MDAMMGIFYEESSRMINELKSDFYDYKDAEEYGQEFIQKVFRVVHTLKADSTMMLFDGIAQLSKKFEKLLYCFRNGPKVIKDTKRFNNVLHDYMEYIEGELVKIPKGIEIEQPPEHISDAIDDYVDKMKTQYNLADSSITGEASVSVGKKAKQIYYIPGAASSVEKKQTTASVSEYEQKEENDVTVIKKSDINKIQSSVTRLSEMVDMFKINFDYEDNYKLNIQQLEELSAIVNELSEVLVRFTKDDLSMVAKKMELLVDEMAEDLHKNVKISIKGEKCVVEKEKRDKISTALIHIIRNSVDHGIEDLEEREKFGKSPMGLIKLEFSQNNGKLRIVVEDDGAGINSKKILNAAQKSGMLKKDAESYSRDEIINLMLLNGVSTTKVPNDYSGRGVGMDVINQNIKELGGTLKITSEEGYGTKIEIEV